jgi:hypothetical protein
LCQTIQIIAIIHRDLFQASGRLLAYQRDEMGKRSSFAADLHAIYRGSLDPANQSIADMLIHLTGVCYWKIVGGEFVHKAARSVERIWCFIGSNFF